MGKTRDLTGIIGEAAALPLFSGCTRDDISSLIEGGEIHVNRHREVIFKFGDPAHYFGIVLTGAYKLSRLSGDGHEAVIHFASIGDVLAALIMAKENPRYPVTVHAMGPSRAIVIPRSVYLSEWLKKPELIAKMQMLLTTRMSRLQNQRLMQRAPLHSKIAALLLQLVNRDDGGSRMHIQLPLTRKEIADSLGVTVESVIRVMSEWAKIGWISTTDRQISILQPESIVRLTMESQD